METIPKKDCEKIGFIKKTHGVRGEVVLEFEPRFEETVEVANRFFVELDGLLVPFFIAPDGFRFKTATTAIINFEWVESSDYARRFVGNEVFLFKDEIVANEEDSFESSLQNYLLIDEKLGEIGHISHTDDFAGNIVLYVQFKENEILVPFNEDFLISINEDEKILVLKLPEGLIEI